MKIKTKSRYKNPRKGYVNNGQGIGEIYSCFLERIEKTTSVRNM